MLLPRLVPRVPYVHIPDGPGEASRPIGRFGIRWLNAPSPKSIPRRSAGASAASAIAAGLRFRLPLQVGGALVPLRGEEHYGLEEWVGRSTPTMRLERPG